MQDLWICTPDTSFFVIQVGGLPLSRMKLYKKIKKHLTMVSFHFKFQSTILRQCNVFRWNIAHIVPPLCLDQARRLRTRRLWKEHPSSLISSWMFFVAKGWPIVEKHFEYGRVCKKSTFNILGHIVWSMRIIDHATQGIAWRTVGWQSSFTGFCPSKVWATPREWIHFKVSQDVSFFYHICFSESLRSSISVCRNVLCTEYIFIYYAFIYLYIYATIYLCHTSYIWCKL